MNSHKAKNNVISRHKAQSQIARNSLKIKRLEKQADQAADAYLSGETGIYRNLSSVEAATNFNISSRAERLPWSIQQDMETSFSADLSQLQIHNDASAHRLTHELNARAFAAGSHIYFSENEYRPNQIDGRKLLAHEIAHALQQTAKASQLGQYPVAVTNIHGTGIAQCVALPLTSTESVPDIETLLSQHKDRIPADAPNDPASKVNLLLLNHREAVRNNNVETYWSTRGGFAQRLESDPILGISFGAAVNDPYISAALFDALKKMNQLQGAINILLQNPQVKTYFYSAEFYQAFLDHQLTTATPFSHIAHFWNNAEFFEPARPDRMYDTVRSYLLGPTRDIPNLGGTPRFQEAATQFIERKNNPTDLIDNEAFFATVWVVKKVDRLRINRLAELASLSAPGTRQSYLNLQQRWLVANGFAQWAEQFIVGESTEPQEDLSLIEALAAQANNPDDLEDFTPETLFVLNALSPSWKAIAEDATALIDSALRIESHRSRGLDIMELGNAREFVESIADRPEFSELHDILNAKLGTLLALNNGQLPEADRYHYFREQAVQHIRRVLHYQVETPLFSTVRRAGMGQELDDEQSRLMYLRLWVLLTVSEFIQTLTSYSHSEDILFELEVRERNEDGEFSGSGRDDVRIAHRIRVARWMYDFGYAVGWSDIGDLGLQILTATQEGQVESQIALIGDWEEDKSVSIGQIREDFNNSTIIGAWAPLRPADLANFFQARYFEQLTHHLDQLVSDRYLSEERALITEAKKRAHDHPGRPRKYVIKDDNFYIALRDEDRGHLDVLYENHPKTQMFLQTLNYPVRVNSKQNIFFWTFPALGDVVAILQSNPVFQQLIDRHQAHMASLPSQEITFDEGVSIQVDVTEPEIAQPEVIEPPEWSIWLGQLNDAFSWWTSLSEDQRDEAFNAVLTTELESFRTGVRESLDEAHSEAISAQRRASIYERHAFIEQYVRPNLSAYDRFDHFSDAPRGGLIYGIPNQVLRDISEVVSRAQPREDQEGHLAVAFLEISDLLLSKFEDNERFDIYAGYKHLIDRAVEFVEAHPFSLYFYLTDFQKNNSTWVSSRKSNLDTVLERFEEFTLNLQMQFGFGGSVANGNEILYGLGEGFTISTREPSEDESPIGGPRFTIDGIEYRLLDVFHNFVYHPPVGDSQGILIIDGEQVRPYREDQEPPSDPRVLFQISINGIAQDITEATDDELLKTLSLAITMEAINRSLQNLGEIIETFNEVLMEGVEFIPGAGQAVMIARIGMSIIQMINSGELDDIKELLYSNPEEIFTNIEERVQRALTPATLWNFLLFNESTFLSIFPADADEDRRRRRTPSRRRGVSAKLRRLARTLINLGRSFALSVGGLQMKLQGPVRGLQLFILSRPLLGFLFRQMDNYLPLLETLSISSITSVAEEVTELNQAIDSIPEKIREIAITVNQIELPDEIFSMEDILEIVLEVVVERLPAKAEVPIRILMMLLEVGDMKGRILRTLGDWIGEVADPNDLWRELRREHIDPLFNTARTEFLTKVISTLNEVGGINVSLPQLGTFEPVEGDLVAPEVEGFSSPTQLNKHFRNRSIGSFSNSSGTVLPPGLRQSVETSFGHDFSHVRLHTGVEGKRVTDKFQAEGLTSGSHIFMPGEFNVQSQKGQHVLRHELTHVLQQTGTRPLGRKYSSSPTFGKQNTGFNFDQRRENAANRIAEQTSKQNIAAKPVDPGAGLISGLQPSLGDAFLSDFFRFMTSYESMQEYSEAALEQSRTIALDPEVRGQINNVARKLREIAGTVNDLHIATTSHLYEVRQDISDRLRGKFRGGDFTQAIVSIAKNAQREDDSGSGASSQSDPEKYLDTRSFARGLKTWIFANTAIEVNIELNLLGAVGTRREIQRDDPITAMRVDDVFLPGIPVAGSGIELWNKAIENTFGTDVSDDQAKRRHRAHARAYLGTLGPTVKAFQSGSYRFKRKVKNDISALVVASSSGGVSLDINKLPPKSYYLNTSDDTAPNPLDASMGRTRLRLGLHGDGSQNGADRESHHLPQYLLLEYFSNSKTQKPFKHPDVLDNLGLNRTGTTILGFQNSSNTQLAVNQLIGSGRGGNMPSILLSRVTHQQANLHVIGEADEESGGGVTQGAAIHNYFRNQIQSLAGLSVREKMFGDSADEFETLISTPPQTPESVQNNIFLAMRHTYKWMRSRMLDQLEDGLVNDELRYYTSLARVATDTSISDANGVLTHQYRISEGEMRNVFVAARGHFDSVMSQSPNNWTVP